MNIEDIKKTITIVHDYPIPGIIFRDITTLLEDSEAFKATVDIMIEKVSDLSFDKIVGVESRGFFWAAPIAYALSKPFILARKPGKLPRRTVSKPFTLEYGKNSVHIHADSVHKGDIILIVDEEFFFEAAAYLLSEEDLISTGWSIVEILDELNLINDFELSKNGG